MASRESWFSEEGLPSSRCGERTPLRTLQNEMQPFSTQLSVLTSKLRLSANVTKMTKGNVRLSDPEILCSVPATKVIQSSTSSVIQKAPTVGIPDTEVLHSSICAKDDVASLQCQTMTEEYETDETVISDSMMVHSATDHIAHSYYNFDSASTDNNLREDSKTTLASGDTDDESVAPKDDVLQNFFTDEDVTFKSFLCDGGEVEVTDATRLPDETIRLPKPELHEPVQDESLNASSLVDCEQCHPADRVDHPYCGTASFTSTVSMPQSDFEKPANEWSDVSHRSYNCSEIGGEIEVLDGTSLADDTETVSLPSDQIAAGSESYNHSINSSIPVCQQHVENGSDHLDHPYCNAENDPVASSESVFLAEEQILCSVNDFTEIKLVIPNGHTGKLEDATFHSSISARREMEHLNDTRLSENKSDLSENQDVVRHLLDNNDFLTFTTQNNIQDGCEEPAVHLTKDKDEMNTQPPGARVSPLTKAFANASDDECVNCQVSETLQKHLTQTEACDFPLTIHRTETSDCSHLRVSVKSCLSEQAQQHPDCVSEEHLSSPAANSVSKSPTESLPDGFQELQECPSPVASLELGIPSPVLKEVSVLMLKADGDPPVDQFLVEDSAIEIEKRLSSSVNINSTGLWAERMDSPMPCPLFNSTAVDYKLQPCPVIGSIENMDVKSCAAPQSEVENQILDNPLITDCLMQQKLRQMAEFLILAAGRMGPAAVVPNAAACVADTVGVPPAEFQSVCVGITPVKLVDHSFNTSGQFERVRKMSMIDASTNTDPLLLNIPAGSLESLSRQELEQRLNSSMIMVEALLQQLAAGRIHGGPPAGPAPSDLRDKLVQTDHTELSQTTMYRDLYIGALSKVAELELEESSLQNLIQSLQDMRMTMSSLTCDVDTALAHMKEITEVAREDHQNLVSHYGEMTLLIKKSKATQAKMVQKVKDALQQRENMRTQMEEAYTAKDAAFIALEQLRDHCATEISELGKSIGSQQELLTALNQTYPEQVSLNKTRTEILSSASDLLTSTLNEQSWLMKELFTVRDLLQKTTPLLFRLHEKAAAALRAQNQHLSARDQAVEERDQALEKFNHVNLNLQNASEQIGDLNLQVTILTTEMGVLRQKLTEREEERSLLERKVTELSATVSSTLASYTFLEQALTSESTKLQQSWKDVQEANDRANELELLLTQSQQRVYELSQDLAHCDQQLKQQQALLDTQSRDIKSLQDLCTQLNGVREMNEFLQIENELAREQVAESECLLHTNLKGLRERNIQCEDLKGMLAQLQMENKCLQDELENTKSKASATQLELNEKLAQAVTDITLLHHTVRGLTNELQAALTEKKEELPKTLGVEHRHPSTSFVDRIMVALATEKREDEENEMTAEQDLPQPVCDGLFSETSAFIRVTAATPKKNSTSTEFEADEEQSDVTKLLADLSHTVTELRSAVRSVQRHKDARLEAQQYTISVLQREQEAADMRYENEVCGLKHQLSLLTSLVERGNMALQQKAQDEETVAKLITEVSKTQDLLNKCKAANNELRTEVAELRCALQQSHVECRFLREELKKSGDQSANQTYFLDENVQLVKEVQRLKMSLQEVEQAKVKLLERAKRHQIIHQTNQMKSENELQILNKIINRVRETLLSMPEVVKNCEQLQQLVDYIG
ncbi:sperm-associated antigen 5 isoform X2 [Thalassophryne amazonica]|uniref:sperm-associated antigen 5 isoform X2 n=1 Tax=Thalassophryne amazonica TaxID=390379 RepID=UPI001470CF98|nr:sperm-associated antigen 5 isoform X2 [Thalassophryne amazonica]